MLVNPSLVITLCGSVRFITEYHAAYNKLSLEGHLVFTIGCLPFCEDNHSKAEKELLDDLHFRKIQRSDAIFVINPGNYIGYSTRREINYATGLGKRVMFLERMS